MYYLHHLKFINVFPNFHALRACTYSDFHTQTYIIDKCKELRLKYAKEREAADEIMQANEIAEKDFLLQQIHMYEQLVQDNKHKINE